MAPRHPAGDLASVKDQHYYSSLAAGGPLEVPHHCQNGGMHGPGSNSSMPNGAAAHPYPGTPLDAKHTDSTNDTWYLGAYRASPLPGDYTPGTSPAGSASHPLPEAAQSPPSGPYSITTSPSKHQPQHQVIDGMVLGAAEPSAGQPTRDFIDQSMIADYLQILRLQQEHQQQQGGQGSSQHELQQERGAGAPAGAGDVRRSLSASDAAAAAAIQAAVGSAAVERRPSTPPPHMRSASETGSGGTTLDRPAAAAVVAGGDGSGPKAASDDQNMVTRFIGYIKEWKLAKAQAAAAPLKRSDAASSSSSLASSVNNAKGGGADAANNVKIWIQPSGPRRPGEGTENEEQGILSAEEVKGTGEVMLHITLLAAGFVIGPSGSSVRDIMRHTGADIKSWTENSTLTGKRRARIFLIGGDARSVAQAVYVITAAVDRYKELCEGKYSGQSVERAQSVLGVEFSYQPPPKTIVPYAASLKGMHPALLNKANQKSSPVSDHRTPNAINHYAPGQAATTPTSGSTGSVMYPAAYQPQLAAAAAAVAQQVQHGRAAAAQFPMQQLPGMYAPMDQAAAMEQYQQMQQQMGAMLGVAGGKPVNMGPVNAMNAMQMGMMGAGAGDMYGTAGSVFAQQQYMPMGPPSPGAQAAGFHAAAMMANAYSSIGQLQPGQMLGQMGQMGQMGPGLVPSSSLTSYGSVGSQTGGLEYSSSGLLTQAPSWDLSSGMPLGNQHQQQLNGQQQPNDQQPHYHQDNHYHGPHSNGNSPSAGAAPSTPPSLRRRNSGSHNGHNADACNGNHMAPAPTTPRGPPPHGGATFMGPPGPMFAKFVPANGPGGLVYPPSPGGPPMMAGQVPFGSVMGLAPMQQMQGMQGMQQMQGMPLSPMASPMKVMQGKSGAVPYLELGGCAYFPSNGGLPSPRMMPTSPGSMPHQQNARGFMPHTMHSLLADNPYLDLGAIGGNLHNNNGGIGGMNGNTNANGGSSYPRGGRGGRGGGRGGRGGSSIAGGSGSANSTPRNRGSNSATPGSARGTNAVTAGSSSGGGWGRSEREQQQLPPRPPSAHSARGSSNNGSEDSDTTTDAEDLTLVAAVAARMRNAGSAIGGAGQEGQQQRQAQQQQLGQQPGHRRSKAMGGVPDDTTLAMEGSLVQQSSPNERGSVNERSGGGWGGDVDGANGQEGRGARGGGAGADAANGNVINSNNGSTAMDTIPEEKPYVSNGKGLGSGAGAAQAAAAGGGVGNTGGSGGMMSNGNMAGADAAPRPRKARPVLPPLVLPNNDNDTMAAAGADGPVGGGANTNIGAGGGVSGGASTPTKQPKLDATDPIVSPGRITLACKVKSARFSKAAQQARQQQQEQAAQQG